MPRSGPRSKKSHGKARKASAAPEEPTPAPSGNSFAALAPTDQGGPAETDEEQPNAADDAGALNTTPAIAASTTPALSAGAVGAKEFPDGAGVSQKKN